MLLNAFFVDPGYRGTGWAFFPAIDIGNTDVVEYACGGVLKKPPDPFESHYSEQWMEHAMSVASILRTYCDKYDVQHFFIEGQNVWLDSAKSSASASRNDLTRLSIMTGMIIARQKYETRVTILWPNAWKGTLSKAQLEKRVKRCIRTMRWACKPRVIPEHQLDAIGMGLSVQGVL